jgi:hypothetical protein
VGAEKAAKWIKAIQGLRAAGRPETAREELQALRQAHPNKALPDDLKAFLNPSETN